MNIDEITANYDRAKAEVEKYNKLIEEHEQEFVDKHVIGKCFITRWSYASRPAERKFYYKVNKIDFLERNWFDFDIYAEHTYSCLCYEEEITEHSSRYEHYITSQHYGERVLTSKNIYEFFTNGSSLKEVSEEEFFEELKNETGIENLKELPEFNYFKYK